MEDAEKGDLKVSYVLFNEFTDPTNNDERVILFLDEFEHVEDVEERKAQTNRTLAKAGQGDVTAKVGVVYFKGAEDEKDDYLLVIPKDGSPTFKWSDMINLKTALEEAKAAKSG